MLISALHPPAVQNFGETVEEEQEDEGTAEEAGPGAEAADEAGPSQAPAAAPKGETRYLTCAICDCSDFLTFRSDMRSQVPHSCSVGDGLP